MIIELSCLLNSNKCCLQSKHIYTTHIPTYTYTYCNTAYYTNTITLMRHLWEVRNILSSIQHFMYFLDFTIKKMVEKNMNMKPTLFTFDR